MTSTFVKLMWFMSGAYSFNTEDRAKFHSMLRAFKRHNRDHLTTEEHQQIDKVLRDVGGSATEFIKPVEEED
jgi:hypothetical protein